MVLGLGNNTDGGSERSDSLDSSGGGSPTGEVRRLASRGYSEMEIIDELKAKGYPNDEIERSMNKVLKNKVSSFSGEERVARGSPDFDEEIPADYSSSGDGISDKNFIAPQPSSSFTNQEENQEDSDFSQPSSNKTGMSDEDQIELEILVEEIIDEKWDNVELELSGLIDDIGDINTELESVKDKVEDLEKSQRKKIRDIEEDADEALSRVESIESRVSSLERAFKEFLPKLSRDNRNKALAMVGGDSLEENQDEKDGMSAIPTD